MYLVGSGNLYPRHQLRMHLQLIWSSKYWRLSHSLMFLALGTCCMILWYLQDQSDEAKAFSFPLLHLLVYWFYCCSMLIEACLLIYLADVQTNGPKVRELYSEEPLSISLQPKPKIQAERWSRPWFVLKVKPKVKPRLQLIFEDHFCKPRPYGPCKCLTCQTAGPGHWWIRLAPSGRPFVWEIGHSLWPCQAST